MTKSSLFNCSQRLQKPERTKNAVIFAFLNSINKMLIITIIIITATTIIIIIMQVKTKKRQ